MDNMPSITRRYDVTSATLKWVALVTMLIDHIGFVIVEWALVHLPLDQELYRRIYAADRAMRAIGRAAFPLFVFLLIEGFCYTHDRTRYLIRLILFLVISEIPFDLAISGVMGEKQTILFYPGYQNVLFTLSIGFVAMWLLDILFRTTMGQVEKVVLLALIVVTALLVAYVLKTDYGAWGVLAVIAGFMAKRRGAAPFWIGLSIIVILTMMNDHEAWAAVIDLPLLIFYHGKKGSRGNKYFYYIFYPAHFFILYLIRTMIF